MPWLIIFFVPLSLEHPAVATIAERHVGDVERHNGRDKACLVEQFPLAGTVRGEGISVLLAHLSQMVLVVYLYMQIVSVLADWLIPYT